MDQKLKQLRARAKYLTPIINIGKNKLAQSNIDHVDRELGQKNLIKIKFLKSAFTDAAKQELIQELSTKTHATVVDAVGNILVLYRK